MWGCVISVFVKLVLFEYVSCVVNGYVVVVMECFCGLVISCFLVGKYFIYFGYLFMVENVCSMFLMCFFFFDVFEYI